jgi:hypothetical protein
MPARIAGMNEYGTSNLTNENAAPLRHQPRLLAQATPCKSSGNGFARAATVGIEPFEPTGEYGEQLYIQLHILPAKLMRMCL